MPRGERAGDQAQRACYDGLRRVMAGASIAQTAAATVFKRRRQPRHYALRHYNRAMPSIILATLNARYTHASLGLRYLLANMGALKGDTRLQEFTIRRPPREIADALLALQPRVIGFGVYIWNVTQTCAVIELLKAEQPGIVIVLGGPEVSFETHGQPICALADYIVTGWGDVTFPKLCAQLLDGPQPLMKIHPGEQPPLDTLTLPYREFTDEDIRQRTLYVEASRGCPFKCEFCLSALDKTAWPFNTQGFLAALESLYARGARRFKFVDRTFNLNVKTSLAILEFFQQKIDAAPLDPCFAHFELVPDHLPETLKAAIARFPAGTLQFEIGIQTFSTEVQQRISRRQDNAKAAANLTWLRTHSQAHLHVDLIAGLPGEDLASFAQGFDQLHTLRPHEIQLGILKRLRGTPIIRHTGAFGMRYHPAPPYKVLATSAISAADMQRIERFARYWNLVANSGRFGRTLLLLLGADATGSAFARFMAFADWLYAHTGQTHQFALEHLFDLAHRYLVETLVLSRSDVETALRHDFALSGASGRLAFMDKGIASGSRRNLAMTLTRQGQHLHARAGQQTGGVEA